MDAIYDLNYHISMKKSIYKNLVKECLKFFIFTILTISLIIWVLQAVNYLDFVIEDGHGFFVYFNYTLLSFPKILSRIYPFAIFLSFSYIILKYEEKNELVIFWNFGIKKIDFINFFIKFSFFFVFLSLFLNALITPLTQDKARSFIRSSDLNFFESILKPKKFISIVKNLTIYFDNREMNGDLKNIFLNDKENVNKFKTTFAKKGVFELRGDKKIFVLYEGKTINYVNGKISEFTFSKTDFNISRFDSTTTTRQKTQESSTKNLIQCLVITDNLKNKLDSKLVQEINNCNLKNLVNIYKELYTRLVKPFYITFLIAVSLLFILKSKNAHTFKAYKIKIYLIGFISIIFLESSSNFLSTNLTQNLLVFTLPFFFVSLIYLYFLTNLRIKKK